MKISFRSSELILPSHEFRQIAQEKRKFLSSEDIEWLNAWESWDLACSPMDDKERRFIRYGHFLGWIDAINKQERKRQLHERKIAKPVE